jgi:hypothetical protein
MKKKLFLNKSIVSNLTNMEKMSVKGGRTQTDGCQLPSGEDTDTCNGSCPGMSCIPSCAVTCTCHNLCGQ